MGINPNWNRWLFASVTTYFQDAISPLKFVAESQNEVVTGDQVNLRMTGPQWLQCTANQYYAEIVISNLIRCMIDSKDFHKIFRMVGIVEAACIVCIPVKKYGNTIGVDDATVVIGQLILQRNGDRDVETAHYGQISAELPAFESTVEAKYRIDLRAD